MNTQTILSMNISKTKKILKLAELGLGTTEIANLIGSGYGFVWVVLNKRHGGQTTPLSTTFSPIAFNRRFGIEIEAYGVSRDVLINKLNEAGISCMTGGRSDSHRGWKVTSDGSILGTNSFEVVSPVLEGEEGLDQLMRVCATLKACRAKVNKSCGLHIHIDAGNFEIKQWKNIFKNYIQIEDVIDSFMPESRRENNNTYCKSLKRSGVNNMIQKIDCATTVTHICSNIFNNSRFFKINPMSFAKHGTIEFRQHSGTIEYQKIRNWVIFLHNLVSYSKNNALNENNFEAITKFNQPEVVAYFEERKNELNNN